MSGFLSGRAARLTGRRLAAILGLCLAACAAVALLAPLVGVTTGRGGRAIELLGLGAFAEGDPAHAILWVRIPRVLASLLVGGALAGAGCALQALLRNPLAEPFTLGISSGSAARARSAGSASTRRRCSARP